MSRNQYTNLIRIRERAQLARQQKELEAFIRAFRAAPDAPIKIPLVMSAKERRSARLDQKHRGKARRQSDTGDANPQ